jgi:hypothetical protein
VERNLKASQNSPSVVSPVEKKKKKEEKKKRRSEKLEKEM